MRVIRFALNDKLNIPNCGDIFYLPKDENHHALNVLRLTVGAEIEILSFKGLAKAYFKSVENGILSFSLISDWELEEKKIKIILALSLINSQRFEWAIEKAVELGADVLQPIISERCKVKISSLGENKVKRWQRISEEARKQSGRKNPFIINKALALKYFFKSLTANETVCYLDPNGGNYNLNNKNIVLLIGPEGGFTKEEILEFEKNKYQAVSLGSTILRAETAALSALAILNNKLNF